VEPHLAGCIAGKTGKNRNRQLERLHKLDTNLELVRRVPAYEDILFRARLQSKRENQPEDAAKGVNKTEFKKCARKLLNSRAQ
jgi:hypothetical protein